MNTRREIYVKKRRRGEAALRISRMFGIPADAFAGTSTVAITSDAELLATGCRRVREYRSCEVVLSLEEMDLTVCGEGLTMHAFFGSQIAVRGRICSVVLERRR